MKVLAINGSPHRGKGNTALILTPFLEGLRDAGMEVELLCTRDLHINPCLGCFGCWTKTLGQCVQEDDMAGLLPRLRQADVWVLATPLYFDGPSGPLKNVMDRMTVFLRLAAEFRDGRSRHLVDEEVQGGKVVLVSNCGLWEIGNFDPLVAQVQGFCQHVRREFAGALLRPHGQTLRDLLKEGSSVYDVLDAAGQAGRELATAGRISDESLRAVGRPLVSLEEYVRNLNETAGKLLVREAKE